MEEERNYTVYMHVCKENNKTYVGITSQNPEDRWGSNGYRYNHNEYFTRAINKYGWDNFEHIILFKNRTKEEAERLEVLFIKILLSNNRTYGYNISNGGESIGKHSEESKKKMSELRKGMVHTMKSKEKMSKQRQGGMNANAKKVICEGKIFNTVTEFSKYYNVKRRSVGSWLNGTRRMPQEFYDKGLRYLNEDNKKIKLQVALIGGNYSNAKKVICDGIIYDSLVDISKALNINYGTIGDWLRGKNKMPQNFIDLDLRYLDSDIIPECQVGHKGIHNPNSKKIICGGIIYDSIGECAERYGIGRRLLNDWLLKPYRIPQEFKDLGLDYYIEEENENIEK